MNCQRCDSNRILSISGKTSDLCSSLYAGREYNGYIPHNLGIGGGDYIEFDLCLECGQNYRENYR
jgi:hypothetical protein